MKTEHCDQVSQPVIFKRGTTMVAPVDRLQRWRMCRGFAVAIVATSVMLLFDRQFENDGGKPPDVAGAFARTAVWLVIGLTAANVISTLLECGLAACPADPVAYELLKGMR